MFDFEMSPVSIHVNPFGDTLVDWGKGKVAVNPLKGTLVDWGTGRVAVNPFGKTVVNWSTDKESGDSTPPAA